jgi:Thioesterase-like superfamily
VQSAFFEPAGNSAFVATAATAGPWSPDAQHGGPPSALAARALERHEPAEGQRLGRVSVDILRPVPVGKLTVRTRTVRPGRRVALLETVLEAGGQEVLHARGWRIAIPDGQVPVIRGDGDAPPLPGPDANGQQLAARLPNAHTAGYLSAIEWRFLDGGFEQPAPGRAWTRPRIPLVAGEDASPMCRALLVADSGSGVSAVLDPARFIFINVDLTVVLPRDPLGEWLLLEAATTTGTQGTGLAETALSDLSGRCGTALQTLLLAPR